MRPLRPLFVTAVLERRSLQIWHRFTITYFITGLGRLMSQNEKDPQGGTFFRGVNFEQSESDLLACKILFRPTYLKLSRGSAHGTSNKYTPRWILRSWPCILKKKDDAPKRLEPKNVQRILWCACSTFRAVAHNGCEHAPAVG